MIMYFDTTMKDNISVFVKLGIMIAVSQCAEVFIFIYPDCHYSCFTCFKMANTCLACNNLMFRAISNNTCPCIDGYFEEA
jgi:hypothetical protein